MRLHIAVALVAVASSVASAQDTRSFARPDAEFPEPFSQLSSVRELRDGRVIAVDRKERRVVAVDLSRKTQSEIGRAGSGPGEYQTPTAVYALLGDSTLLQDPASGRFLVIGPDARPAGVFTPVGGGGGILRGIDARGRMYYQAPAVALPTDGSAPTSRDSIPLIRYDPRAQTHDTLAFARVAPTKVKQTAGGRVVVGNPRPFAPNDDWAVTADGRLVLVRVSDFHVEVVTRGADRVVGARVAFTPEPVTSADKEAYRRSLAGLRPTFRSSTGQPIEPPANFQLPEPEWDEIKPPFSSGATLVSPEGQIWVRRNRPPNTALLFAIFDAQGRPAGQAEFPTGTTLLGFGARSVYAYRTDSDGFQYLQRYVLR